MGLGEKGKLCLFVKGSLFVLYLGTGSGASGPSSLNFLSQLQF